MQTKRTCQHCGKVLGPEAIEGLCAECLMKVGLGIGTEASGVPPQTRRAFVPPTVAELGPKFPQFEILALIGHGGMGAVYKTRQKQLERIVALKILPPGIGEDLGFADRFAREAKAMAKLNHPGIVTIHDFGCAEGLYYFVMEFVDGVSLHQLMKTGRVSSREALAIVPQICDALQYAHDQGIVHRDIKPENILLDRQGRVKVADFGLAKLVGTLSEAVPLDQLPGAAGLTEAGKVMGTPSYMAPEQMARPGAVDHQADIYALGVVFYQMLTGELPAERIVPPSRKVQIDVRLDEVVLCALEKEPARRYQQISQVKTAVETIAQTATARRSENQNEPGWRPRHWSGLKAVRGAKMLISVLVVVLLPFGWWLHRSVKARRAEAEAELEESRATALQQAQSATDLVTSHLPEGSLKSATPGPTFYYVGGGGIAVPARRVFQSGLTVRAAIKASGGLTAEAIKEKAELTRAGSNAPVIIDLTAIEKGTAPDPELMPGDTLMVLATPPNGR